jgi:hypothetical protein
MTIQNFQDVVLTIKEIWPIVVLIATPIGALTGFTVHILSARKSKLEIEKLHHEIERLKRENAARDSVVQVATFAQTLEYAPPGRDLRAMSYKSGTYLALVIGIVIAVAVFLLYRYFIG